MSKPELLRVMFTMLHTNRTRDKVNVLQMWGGVPIEMQHGRHPVPVEIEAPTKVKAGPREVDISF